MSQKFHNAGRTYAVGKAETDAELARRLAHAKQRDALGDEVLFILDVLAGKLPLDAFEGPADGPWACFARYCHMQADAAARAGFADLADVMHAAGNRAARKR